MLFSFAYLWGAQIRSCLQFRHLSRRAKFVHPTRSSPVRRSLGWSGQPRGERKSQFVYEERR